MGIITPHDIRDFFSYAQRYNDAIFVLYIDDSILLSESFHALSADIVSMLSVGIKVMIVAGSEKAAARILKTSARQPTGDAQRRRAKKTIITEKSMTAVQTAVFDAASRAINYFARHRQTAVLGNWTLARGFGVVNQTDYKHHGFVETIDAQAIHKLLDDRVIPIFPAIGWSHTGTPYYLNCMDVAVQASIVMRASKLVFMLDGNPHTYFTALSQTKKTSAHKEEQPRRITASRAKKMLSSRAADSSSIMFSVMEHGLRALEKRVDRVHVLDGRRDGSLLSEVFRKGGSGVMIYSDEYESIVPMRPEDAADVLTIMNPLMEQGVLKPRTMEILIQRYKDFVVYRTDNRIRGVAALHKLDSTKAELAALAAASDDDSKGIGKKITEYLLSKAKRRGYKKVFALTLKAGDWFEKLGFTKLENASQLPSARRAELATSKRKSRVYVIDTKNISSDLV